MSVAVARASSGSRLVVVRDLAIVGVLICGVIVFTIGHGLGFLSIRNLSNILDSASLVAIFAVGEAVVIMAGAIDLSIAAITAASGIFAGRLDFAAIIGRSPAPFAPGLLAPGLRRAEARRCRGANRLSGAALRPALKRCQRTINAEAAGFLAAGRTVMCAGRDVGEICCRIPAFTLTSATRAG